MVPSLISSMVIAIWFGFLLSGAMMFLLARNFFPGYRALVPAIFYQILPFHLYELYLRGSFAALFAYIWFPLVLLAVYKIHAAGKPTLSMTALSFAYAALIMTHLASAFMFSLLASLILLGFIVTGRLRSFLRTFCAFAGGLALSSIYFIPALVERKYVHMRYLEDGPWGRYVDNFLFTMDKIHHDTSQFSHYYLLLHSGAIADLILFVLILSIAKKQQINPRHSLFVISASWFVLSFLLMTPLSKPLVDLIPGLSTLLFPYRWMAMMELALAILSGYLLFGTEKRNMIADEIRDCSLILIFFFISAAIIWETDMLSGETVKRFEYSAQSSYNMTPGVENIPSWARNWLELHYALPSAPILFSTGTGSYRVELWEPQKRVIKLKSSEPSRIRISTFYYPGWEAKLDEERTDITIENGSGAMIISIPPGEHTLKLIFGDTTLRAFSRYVSYGSFVILVIIAQVSLRKELGREG
jgi:hypothetical protein